MADSASLVLSPRPSYSELDAALRGAGWTAVEVVAVTPPLVAGEPEIAQWRRGPGEVLATYTLNPAVGLRVLRLTGDPAGEHRAELARLLPVQEAAELERSLGAGDPREVLRAILAAEELEAVELAGPIGLAAASREPTVAENAARVHLHLLHLQAARLARSDRVEELAGTLAAIAGNAMPLLAALAGAAPDEVLGLQPSEEDCAAAFTERVAAGAYAAYQTLWADPPEVEPGPDRTDLQVRACPAELFAGENLFSRAFPGGYLSLAPYLRPGRVWLAWRYCRPGSRSGLAMDGLVHVRGDWVWFPKPYRVIRGLVGDA